MKHKETLQSQLLNLIIHIVFLLAFVLGIAIMDVHYIPGWFTAGFGNIGLFYRQDIVKWILK